MGLAGTQALEALSTASQASLAETRIRRQNLESNPSILTGKLSSHSEREDISKSCLTTLSHRRDKLPTCYQLSPAIPLPPSCFSTEPHLLLGLLTLVLARLFSSCQRFHMQRNEQHLVWVDLTPQFKQLTNTRPCWKTPLAQVYLLITTNHPPIRQLPLAPTDLNWEKKKKENKTGSH